MSSTPLVLSTVANNVAHVVMNRPGAMNAMSRGMITELRQALEHAQGDPKSGVGVGSNPTMDLVTTLQYIWRFPTDPISHACWAGLTGYFIGLAFTGEYRWYRVGWIGLAMDNVLHGLNDWTVINGHSAWLSWWWSARCCSSPTPGSADAARASTTPTPTSARPRPVPPRPAPLPRAPSSRETDPDRLLREFKKTLGHDDRTLPENCARVRSA